MHESKHQDPLLSPSTAVTIGLEARAAESIQQRPEITYGTILKTMVCPLFFACVFFALAVVMSTAYLPYFMSGGFYCLGNILQKGFQGYRARQRLLSTPDISNESLQDGDLVDGWIKVIAMLHGIEATLVTGVLVCVGSYGANPFLLAFGASMAGFKIGNSIDRSLGLPVLENQLPVSATATANGASVVAIQRSITYCTILKTMACPLLFTGIFLALALFTFTNILPTDWLLVDIAGGSLCLGNILQKGSQGYRARQRLFSMPNISNESLQHGDKIDNRNVQEIALSFGIMACLLLFNCLNAFLVGLTFFIAGFGMKNQIERSLRLPVLLEATALPLPSRRS